MVSVLAAGAVVAVETVEQESSPEPLAVYEVELDRAAEIRADLEASGVTILTHLAPHRWLVAGVDDSAVPPSGVRRIESWTPRQAISAELREMAVLKRESGDIVPVIVALAPGVEPYWAAREIREAGAEIDWIDGAAQPAPQVGLRIPGRRLAAVVEALQVHEGLLWAVPQSPIRLLNGLSVWRCQSGVRGSTPVFDRGLRGEGQVIGIMDTGIDIDDCRFDDPLVGLPALNQSQGTDVEPRHRKVLAVDFHWEADWPVRDRGWDEYGHGTHVAGSAAGDEGANGLHDRVDGMAPAAKLVIQDGGARTDDCADLPGLGCPVKPLGPVLEQAWAQGARIHTNSWGDEENFLPFGRYTERTADVDRFVWQHRDTLVLFAAGNAGPLDGTVISPSTAKNAISVGATLHGDTEPPCVVDFSSRGWTRDGRIKPDLVAPGWMVVSAGTNGVVPAPSCLDATSSGTSMAAPTVAGLAALVRQYFTDGFYPTGRRRATDVFEPSAALVKAMLIASTVDLTTMGCAHEPAPSRDQGWGIVQLDTALAFDDVDRRLIVDDHRTGFTASGDEPVQHAIELLRDGPLEAVLVWTDAPSTSLADINLINDLDLVITGPDGTYRGNVMAAGASVPGGSPDRRNNVEVVRLPAAGKGAWSVEVTPHAVAAPAQDWALVVTGAVRLAASPRQASGRVLP